MTKAKEQSTIRNGTNQQTINNIPQNICNHYDNTI